MIKSVMQAGPTMYVPSIWAPNDNDSGVRSTKVCNIVSPYIANRDEGESVVSALMKFFETFEKGSGYHFKIRKVGEFSETDNSL